jgi:hypothetical protein
VLAATGALASIPASAADADLKTLREEIAQMKQAYEQRIKALESRLEKAETTAVKAEVSATQAQASARQAAARPAQANAFNPEISLILQGRYKDMKEVPELVFGANIDPWWRGQLMLGVRDDEVEVEEAWVQTLGIGHGIGLKGGRVRSGIGYLNEQHSHAWDFSDAPLMYTVMFGEHASYAQDGLQLKWVAPTETFIELGAEFGRGAEFPGTDRNKNGAGNSAIFAHVGGDVGASNNWRAGVSYLRTTAKDRETHFEDVGGLEAQGVFDGDSRTWIADFVWKWAPEGNAKYRNLKVQGEWFQRKEKGTLNCLDEDRVGNACDPLLAGASVLSDYKTRQSGWYLQGVYQFTPNWRAGLRYDRLDSGNRDFGVNAANLVVDNYNPSRSSLMADYSWSEFSRLRLQYAHDKSMQGVTDNQVTLQYIMSLGAHGAHKF